MLVRGEVLYWGTPLLQFVPWRRFAFETLARGWLPLWNPMVGMGAPLLANHQSALLYPPNWILALTAPGWGEGLLVLAHLVFAGIGMVLLLRRLDVAPLGQAVGAAAFASCSFLVGRAGFFSLNAAASYLPWLVLCADVAAEAALSGVSIRWVPAILALAVVVGLQALAGHAQSMAYGLLFAVPWSAWRAATRGGGAAAARLAGIWLLAGLLGLAVSAAQVLPTAEYLAESSREGGVEETLALTYSFWPWRTLGVLLPGLFGHPGIGDYWGYGNYWEDAVYLGVLPALMAVTAVVRAGRLGRSISRMRNFLVIAAGVSFVLALGSNTPVFPILFRYVPLFGLFNAPTRFNLITVFCVALLAGIGAGLWTRPKGRALYWTRLGTAGAGAVLVLGAAAAAAPTGLRGSFGPAFALAGLWLLVAGALALLWPMRVGYKWIALVGAIVSLDLVIAGAGLNPTASASIYRGPTTLAAATGDGHRLFLDPAAERVLKFDRTHRFDDFQSSLDPRSIRASGLPNTPMLDDLPSANNFDPLLPARYVDWISALTTAPPESASRRLRLMDVGWLAGDVGVEPPWTIYEQLEGARRVRLVPSAIAAADSAEAMLLIGSAAFDPETDVILETDTVPQRRGGVGSASISPSSDPNRVVVDVAAPKGGWLVLSDLWFPGWVAAVDGAEVESFPADAAFRGVWVPPGASQVVWEYRPASFRTGAVLSAAGLVALIVLAGLWVVRRPRA